MVEVIQYQGVEGEYKRCARYSFPAHSNQNQDLTGSSGSIPSCLIYREHCRLPTFNHNQGLGLDH